VITFQVAFVGQQEIQFIYWHDYPHDTIAYPFILEYTRAHELAEGLKDKEPELAAKMEEAHQAIAHAKVGTGCPL